MKKLTDEMQKVYDFCIEKEESCNKNLEKVEDFTLQMMFSNQGTAYWAVRNFIEANFMED